MEGEDELCTTLGRVGGGGMKGGIAIYERKALVRAAEDAYTKKTPYLTVEDMHWIYQMR